MFLFIGFMEKTVEKIVAKALLAGEDKPAIFCPTERRKIFLTLLEHPDQNFFSICNKLDGSASQYRFYSFGFWVNHLEIEK